MSLLEHQSDVIEAPVSWVDQDSVLATVCNSVSRANFLDSEASVLLMSPKRSVAAPIPATVVRHSNHHKRRLSNVPIPAGINRPKLQQPHSRVCVLKPLPPLIQSSEQSPTIPAKPSEILAEEAIRTPGQSSGCGTTSRRGVMSTASSLSPRCWASDELCSSSVTSASLLELHSRHSNTS